MPATLVPMIVPKSTDGAAVVEDADTVEHRRPAEPASRAARPVVHGCRRQVSPTPLPFDAVAAIGAEIGDRAHLSFHLGQRHSGHLQSNGRIAAAALPLATLPPSPMTTPYVLVALIVPQFVTVPASSMTTPSASATHPVRRTALSGGHLTRRHFDAGVIGPDDRAEGLLTVPLPLKDADTIGAAGDRPASRAARPVVDDAAVRYGEFDPSAIRRGPPPDQCRNYRPDPDVTH